jgi:hypothetical protein
MRMDRPFQAAREGRPESLMWTAPAFVGRREELARIERCLQDAVAGHPRVVLMPVMKVFARVFRQSVRVQSQAVHEAVEPS